MDVSTLRPAASSPSYLHRHPSAQRLGVPSTGTRGVSDSVKLCLCLAQPHVPMWPAKARLFHNAFQSSYYSETSRTGMVSSAVQGPYCRGSGWL